jgi:exodeoxyribonuclease III
MKALKQHFSNENDFSKPLIWCGDFNIAPEGIDTFDPAATDGQVMCSLQERELLADIKRLGFVDSFRQLNNDTGHYSWWDYRIGAFRRNLGYRIDHIWANAILQGSCTNSWIDKEPRKQERPSDHVPVIAEYEI